MSGTLHPVRVPMLRGQGAVQPAAVVGSNDLVPGTVDDENRGVDPWQPGECHESVTRQVIEGSEREDRPAPSPVCPPPSRSR